jgi:EAL domain-containing protein (putative c-di-GMP-specific phosphodiesterase class I)
MVALTAFDGTPGKALAPPKPRGVHPIAGTIRFDRQRGRLGALAEACRTCVVWQATEPGVRVTVNVPAVQFDHKEYPDQVFAVLAEPACVRRF